MLLTSYRYTFIFCLTFLWVPFSYAQQRSLNQRKLFVKYLIDNKQLNDAKVELTGILPENLNSEQLDTLSYLFGSILHKQKNHDSSSVYFSRVSTSSTYYYESRFLHTINMLLTNRNDSAMRVLETITYDKPYAHQPLLPFEKASLSLIKRDYVAFNKHIAEVDSGYYPLTAERTDLLNIYHDVTHHKKRYGAVAGLLSAAVPGLGKVYARQYGQGIAAFVMVTMLGASATEIYIRSGPRDAQFIVITSLFGMFYIGNIWGSVFSIKIQNEKYHDQVNKNIMLNMRIPVARIFN